MCALDLGGSSVSGGEDSPATPSSRRKPMRVSVIARHAFGLVDLAAYLGSQGVSVTYCAKADELSPETYADKAAPAPDIVVLAVQGDLREEIAIVRRLRDDTRVLCMAIASEDNEEARISLLEAGCDDCVMKHTTPREVLARMRAMLRRAAIGHGLPLSAVSEAQTIRQAAGSGKGPLDLGFGWTLCCTRREIFRPDGTSCAATTAEFNLLACLAMQPGVPVSRNDISQAVYRRNYRADDRSVDNLVVRLRRKLETDPQEPKVLRSVRLIGYMFAGFEPLAIRVKPARFPREAKTEYAQFLPT